MKRIITVLFILLVIGAAVFAVGYLPIRLQTGQVGVLYSKTSGWHAEPIEPGRFAWRWELLIPTNASIYQFSAEPRTVEVRSSAVLPSADVYARLLEGNPSLSQNVRLRVRYRALPETLVRSAPRGLRGDNLDEWFEDTDDEIRSATLVILGSAITDLVDGADLVVPTADLSARALSALKERFTDLDVQSLVVETLDLPDPALYRLARETYATVQAAREAALIEAARTLARNEATTDQRVATLQQYGRIFSEYPILLEYLEISARTGRDPLSIESLQQIQATVQD